MNKEDIIKAVSQTLYEVITCDIDNDDNTLAETMRGLCAMFNNSGLAWDDNSSMTVNVTDEEGEVVNKVHMLFMDNEELDHYSFCENELEHAFDDVVDKLRIMKDFFKSQK